MFYIFFIKETSIIKFIFSLQSDDEFDDESDADDEYKNGDKSTDKSEDCRNNYVLSVGLAKAGFKKKRQNRVRYELNIDRFKAFYGVGPKIVRIIFDDIRGDEFPQAKLKDILLAFNWLKLYDTEHVLAGRWGYCEDNIRCKVKEYVRRIQFLKHKKIVFGGFDENEVFIVSVDGVNFRTQEFRLDPSSKWYDHKTKSAGLTYELALAIRRQALVWINGPFPAGAKNDGSIFRGGTKKMKIDEWDKSSLYFKMPPNTRAVADSGYAGVSKVTTTHQKHSKSLKKFLTRAKQRQESFHTRLKSFHILEDRFRHGTSTKNKMDLHKMCVEAVCVIVQYDIENGNPIFETC